jgi:conjugal transfer pilus assembly protein TraW
MRADELFIKFTLLLIILMSVFVAQKIYAYDGGVMGETYLIKEQDFLETIQSRVQEMQKNGQWQSLQNRMQQDAINYRDRPKSVAGITRAQETKKWEFDPSIVLEHDVTTPDGKLIAIAGSRINPLVYISLSKALIFFNGDDAEQVRWVMEQNKKLKGKTKLILINGSVLEQEKQLKSPLYFDQAGKLTDRFHIKHVPAIVIQEGTHLNMIEVSL